MRRVRAVQQVDCNAISGTCSQENGFTIKLGASSMAFCDEAALDTPYVQLPAMAAKLCESRASYGNPGRIPGEG